MEVMAAIAEEEVTWDLTMATAVPHRIVRLRRVRDSNPSMIFGKEARMA